jgi:N-acylneuraminate cytidylyltransferase
MSSEVNPVVLRRCEKLNLECYHQLKDSKYKCFLQWCEEKNISPSEVIYIGNDENDVECLKNAGCGIVPADAHDSAKKVSDFVLSKKGGDGAVRELADSISIYFNKT